MHTRYCMLTNGNAGSPIEMFVFACVCVCLFEKIVRNEWATRKEEREKAADEEEADSRLAKARQVIVGFCS